MGFKDEKCRVSVLKDEKGQASVFLCVILPALILFAGLLIDFSRIKTGEAQVKRAVASAVKSALAGYDSRLKNGYGIFALSENDAYALSGVIRKYVEKNLMIDKSVIPEETGQAAESFAPGQAEEGKKVGIGKRFDLYGFRIEDITAVPLFNLAENRAVERQILEYMKYRAPKEIAEEIIEKLSAVRDAGKMAEAYGKKTLIDKLLGKMGKAQASLKTNIDGLEKSGGAFINGFNENGRRDGLINSCADLLMECRELWNNAKEIEDEILKLKNREQEKNEGKKRDYYGKKIGLLEKKKQLLLKSIFAKRNELDACWSNICENETGAFIKPNQDALENISRIVNMAENAEAAIKDLKLFLKANFGNADELSGRSGSGIENEGGFSGGFGAILGDEIEKLEELILCGKRAYELAETCRRNIESLEGALARLNEARRMLWAGMESWDGTETVLSRDAIISLLGQGSGSYCNKVAYGLSVISGGGFGGNDPRNGVENKVKSVLREGKTEDIDIRKAGIALEELPSRGKKAYGAGASYGASLSEIEKDIDFANNDEEFTGRAWEFLKLVGNSIPSGLKKLRDDIYIDEYIMGMFEKSVAESKADGAGKGNAVPQDAGTRNRQTFFRSEVEYILHGNPSEKANRIMTEAQILLVRFGMNTLHVYMDPDKRRLAGGIASAAAGLWTGGAGIPVVSNLIMCSWGMAESVLDLKDLLAGESVPLYKSGSDWKLDMGLPKGTGKTERRLAFSYHDYLRLFLLLENRDKKLGRLEDLIELNIRKNRSDFRMISCNTCLKVEATVSMKYFFVGRLLIPFAGKAADGRHKFKIAIYDGY